MKSRLIGHFAHQGCPPGRSLSLNASNAACRVVLARHRKNNLVMASVASRTASTRGSVSGVRGGRHGDPRGGSLRGLPRRLYPRWPRCGLRGPARSRLGGAYDVRQVASLCSFRLVLVFVFEGGERRRACNNRSSRNTSRKARHLSPPVRLNPRMQPRLRRVLRGSLGLGCAHPPAALPGSIVSAAASRSP